MDPRHRDRIAFVRVCSGVFERGMQAKLARNKQSVTLAKPMRFLAQERHLVDSAYPGDILGLWDSGQLKIGDTITTDLSIDYEGIPRFSPEHFMRVELNEPLKRKQLKKGLTQLSEEGAVQVFFDRQRLERDPILGAVGLLQFDVVRDRLEREYGVRVSYTPLPYQFARWIEGDEFDPDVFERRSGTTSLLDVEGRPIVLFSSQWMLQRLVDDHPELRFVAAVQPGRASS